MVEANSFEIAVHDYVGFKQDSALMRLVGSGKLLPHPSSLLAS